MEVIFLKAKQRLVKQISLGGKRPYPLVKKFTSHHYKIDKTPEVINYWNEIARAYQKNDQTAL